MSPQPNKQNKNNSLKQAAVLIGVGIQMGVVIYLFVLLGKWLDTKTGNDKLFLIIFTLAGVAASLYLVVKQLNNLNNK